MVDKTEIFSTPSPSFFRKDILSYINEQVGLDYLSSRSKEPMLLLESAGKKSCCIFRVPERFAETNPEAYKPKVVSIGPYHHGGKHLEMIQQHKLRFLHLFLCMARNNGADRNVLFKAVMELEEKIRLSYSEDLGESSEKLVYMMILDGCFILMLFLIVSRIIESDESEDPIFTIPWILPSIESDLLLLENQVPFFVLQTLFDESNIGLPGDLNRMAFSFFNLSMNKPERYWVKHRNFEAKHLLDLIRMSFIPMDEYEDFQLINGESGIKSSSDFTLLLSATRLSAQGVDFRLRSDADSMLDIRFKNNKLQIPLLRLDGFISSILVNCVAFEQFYTKSTNHITSYVVFMGCLLNSEEDATFLSDENRIIENYFGSENEVSQFFKTVCKDVVFDIHTSYLQNVFAEVNENTSTWYAEYRSHLKSPWKLVSNSYSFVSSMLQTIAAILFYLSDQNARQTE
ncbi:hypothetical protein ISN45_Aa05g015270 [Arabidopsis thaliana x Arabidopsis arenosa]|uniref:Uncharacterized protein n=1 Tax=Arabidopsis thaliana x Arabidopsis arenosa TaxID=1240361 RepID=A0A8T1ZKP2_9BRAS|nr:hypothetical protein ISN45_Aa05g015270 [Arabidopsis thaliana x Arabidopsis arenosa]